MSEVRMCDRCGNIFSVLAEDFQQVTVERIDPETAKVIKATMHTCSNCSLTPFKKRDPNEIEGTVEER